jgi:hypothetical protein
LDTFAIALSTEAVRIAAVVSDALVSGASTGTDRDRATALTVIIAKRCRNKRDALTDFRILRCG